MEYSEYLRSDHWKNLRSQKLRRTKRCGICASEENLHVHHLNYRSLHDVKLSDLRVLCERCHFLGHKLHREGKFVFKGGTNHHSRWVYFKEAVKKELGLLGVNVFWPASPVPGMWETDPCLPFD